MRYISALFIIFLIIFLLSVNVYGYEDIEKLPEIDKVESAVRDNADISFKRLLRAVISGEDVTDMLKKDLRSFIKKQLRENSKGIKSIIAISIICGIINILSQDINDRSTAELIGLTGRVIILGLASSSFKDSIDMLRSCIQNVTDIINSAIPFIIALVSARGQSAGGGLLFALGTELTASGINSVLIPLLTMGTALKLVNIISGREILDKLSELFLSAVTYSLKICAYIFVFLIGLERISGGIISKSAGSILKSAVKMVPVVGEIVGGTGDIALTAILAVGNAAGIALIMIIIIISSIPLVKIGITAFVYRLAAAVLEPVCDKAVISVIDAVGEANFKVLAALFTVNAMFVMSLTIILCSVR